MLRFLAKAVLFVLLQTGVFLLLWRPDMPGQVNMLATTLDKHVRLARSPGPKVVITGGSNVPFGIQSPRLEALLARPVVNMGLAAGLGAPFLLNEIAPAVAPGDVVIGCFEYDLLEGRGHALALRQLLEFRPQSLRFLPAPFQKGFFDEEALSVIGAVVRRSQIASPPQASLLPADAWYPRTLFNPWGDFTGHYGRPSVLVALTPDDPVFNPRIPRRVHPEIAGRLVAFGEHCRQRQARFVLTWPPLPREVYERRRQDIEALAAQVRALPHLEVVGSPVDYAADRSAFYDLTYHLNDDGARRRTDRLAEQLHSTLTAPPATNPGP